MIRKAEIKDLSELSSMLEAMYCGLFGDLATKDELAYRTMMMEYLTDPKTTVYISSGKGFFIVRDETEAVTPTLEVYNGIAVYINPEHRKTSLLAHFYKRLFKDYPTGYIIGRTEINSEHIAVLDKRHTLISQVYRIERS